MFTRAVELDHQSNYKEAYDLYCKVLQYFVAVVNSKYDSIKKQILHENYSTYMKFAEEIRILGDQICDFHFKSSIGIVFANALRGKKRGRP